MKITRGLSIGIALFAILSALVLGLFFSVPAVDELPRCLNSTLIAIETARTPGEVDQIWKQLSEDGRRKLKGNLLADFGFMAGYGSLFVLLGLIGRRRSRLKLAGEKHARPGVVASTAAVVLAIVAVLLDVGENILALSMPPATASTVNLMRQISLGKWTTVGLTVILLWWALRPSRRGPALYRLLAWFMATFALIGGGLAILGRWDTTKLELVIPFLGLVLLGAVPLFGSFWDAHLGVKESEHRALEFWPQPTAGQ